MERTAKWIGLVFLLLLAVLCPKDPYLAQAAGPFLNGPTDRQELSQFLDQFFAGQMAKWHVPGAAFVLVKDSEIFLAKGYGYADLERKIPISPEQTIFRVGSISKLFTATAVMQLADQGLIRLQDDVNHYLKRFQLDAAFAEPVTIANLLTHTGGFDQHYIEVGSRTEAGRVPLGPHLTTRMPSRLFPPGQLYSYSNYGISLAGYLVEEVSGLSFIEYVNKNILQPLGMAHSTFEQPLPPHLASDLAVGYTYLGDRYQSIPFEYFNVVPAGALNATTTDIARFMIAHLNNGRYGNVRILSEPAAQEMHRQQFTHHPRLPGMAYGFRESFANNQRALWHNGTVRGYATLLYLLPDQNLGFYLAYNTWEPELRQELLRQFLDHYYPIQVSSPNSLPDDQRNPLHRFVGDYRNIEYPHHTVDKLAILFGTVLQYRVTANSDGTLQIGSARYVEIEPLLFRQVDDEEYVAFRENSQGQITHLFISGDVGPAALERIPWYETSRFHLELTGITLLVFLSAAFIWFPGRMFLTRRKHPLTVTPTSQVAGLFLSIIAILNLFFFIGVVLVMSRDPFVMVYGLPGTAVALLIIPNVTTMMTAGLLPLTLLAWKNHYWSLPRRCHYTLTTLSALLFAWLTLYWNLIGFRS